MHPHKRTDQFPSQAAPSVAFGAAASMVVSAIFEVPLPFVAPILVFVHLPCYLVIDWQHLAAAAVASGATRDTAAAKTGPDRLSPAHTSQLNDLAEMIMPQPVHCNGTPGDERLAGAGLPTTVPPCIAVGQSPPIVSWALGWLAGAAGPLWRWFEEADAMLGQFAALFPAGFLRRAVFLAAMSLFVAALAHLLLNGHTKVIARRELWRRQQRQQQLNHVATAFAQLCGGSDFPAKQRSSQAGQTVVASGAGDVLDQSDGGGIPSTKADIGIQVLWHCRQDLSRCLRWWVAVCFSPVPLPAWVIHGEATFMAACEASSILHWLPLLVCLLVVAYTMLV
jgi:hypothetical protein